MNRLLLVACLALAPGSAGAQFSINLNRLVDTVKNVGKATSEID